MEYYSRFLLTILLYKVNCIRVTHPCAGRHLVQAPMLPLDLHVLSLPLAFILSQDQTLHCNAFIPLFDKGKFLFNEYQSFLTRILTFSFRLLYFTLCQFLLFSMNLSITPIKYLYFQTDCKDTNFIFLKPNFFYLFF